MVAFATAHCVMGKLGLQSVRNWFNGMKKFFNNISFALSNCRWHPHQYREEKAERGILVWKRSQGSVFRVQSFLGRPQKKFLEKNQDACLDILVNLNYYKEKAENPKAGEAQDLSFVFFGNLESQRCLTFVREGLGTGETTINWREFGSVHGECTAGRRGSDESGTKQGQFLRGALNTRQGDKLIWKQFANCWLEV